MGLSIKKLRKWVKGAGKAFKAIFSVPKVQDPNKAAAAAEAAEAAAASAKAGREDAASRATATGAALQDVSSRLKDEEFGAALGLSAPRRQGRSRSVLGY